MPYAPWSGEPAVTKGSSEEPLAPGREVGIKELASTVCRVIAEVEGGDRVVVTRRGKPVAAILSMDEAELFFLAHAEQFARMRLDARREDDAKDSLPLEEL